MGTRVRPWTPTEDATLRREWQELGTRFLRGKLPGRTWLAIACRAERLGLPLGIPQGWLSVSEAARRAGYSQRTLRELLDRQGVRMKRHAGRSARIAHRPHRAVEWDAVLVAVAADQRTESLTHAAARFGVSRQTITHWLREAGVTLPGVRGQPVRMDPAVIDRVVAERRRAA